MPSLDIADYINETCPWSGEPVQADSLTEYHGQVVGFCNPGCRDKFETALRHFEEAKGLKGLVTAAYRRCGAVLNHAH